MGVGRIIFLEWFGFRARIRYFWKFQKLNFKNLLIYSNLFSEITREEPTTGIIFIGVLLSGIETFLEVLQREMLKNAASPLPMKFY